MSMHESMQYRDMDRSMNEKITEDQCEYIHGVLLYIFEREMGFCSSRICGVCVCCCCCCCDSYTYRYNGFELVVMNIMFFFSRVVLNSKTDQSHVSRLWHVT